MVKVIHSFSTLCPKSLHIDTNDQFTFIPHTYTGSVHIGETWCSAVNVGKLSRPGKRCVRSQYMPALTNITSITVAVTPRWRKHASARTSWLCRWKILTWFRPQGRSAERRWSYLPAQGYEQRPYREIWPFTLLCNEFLEVMRLLKRTRMPPIHIPLVYHLFPVFC